MHSSWLTSFKLIIYAVPVFICGYTPWAVALTEITIGTGGKTGVYYPTGKAICKAVNKNTRTHGIHCTAVTTNGSIDNIDRLRAGKINFAIVQSDTQFYAVKGYGPFRKAGPDQDLRAALSFFSETFTVVARADTPIRTLNDLKGKRVNIGNPGSGQRTDMELVMGLKKWSKSDFALATELTSTQHGPALCSNKIDAFVFVAGHPNNSIKETADHCDIRLVQTYDTTIKKLIDRYPYYSRVRIPANTYKNNPTSIPTYGVKATFLTSAQTPDKIVKTVIQSIFDDFIDFRFQHRAFFHLEPEEMVRTKHSAPLHPGAAAYFRNMGYKPEVEHVKAPRRR